MTEDKVLELAKKINALYEEAGLGLTPYDEYSITELQNVAHGLRTLTRSTDPTTV